MKATGLVLSRYDSTGFRIDIRSRNKTGGHESTSLVGELMAGISRNNRFAYICRLSVDRLINNCFAWKNGRWATNMVFSNFFAIGLHLPLWRDRILHRQFCVDKCWLGLVMYNRISTYRCLRCGAKPIIFALPPKLAQQIFC